MIALPFTGPAVSPGPALQFSLWLALGKDPHDSRRPRVMKDAKGWDCNDYAYEAVKDLRSEGRKVVCYVDCKTEPTPTAPQGEQHMIAVYLTDDGTIYARDNRTYGDLPLAQLVSRGYTLEASSVDGEVWRAFA